MAASKRLGDWIEQNGGVGCNFGKTQYVAEVTGEHEKYNLDRSFISEKIDSSYSGKTGKKAVQVDDLREGAVYEVRGDSWSNKQRRLYKLLSVEENDDSVTVETELLGGEDEALAALAEPA
jgi:hypothetical protein